MHPVNQVQKLVIAIAALLSAVAVLYPPFGVVSTYTQPSLAEEQLFTKRMKAEIAQQTFGDVAGPENGPNVPQPWTYHSHRSLFGQPMALVEGRSDRDRSTVQILEISWGRVIAEILAVGLIATAVITLLRYGKVPDRTA